MRGIDEVFPVNYKTLTSSCLYHVYVAPVDLFSNNLQANEYVRLTWKLIRV